MLALKNNGGWQQWQPKHFIISGKSDFFADKMVYIS